MSKRVEITGKELEQVAGGYINYTWDCNTKTGTCGLQGQYNFKFDDYDGFKQFIRDHDGLSDVLMLTELYKAGYIWK